MPLFSLKAFKRFVLFGGLASTGIGLNRLYKSQTDEISNPNDDSFLKFADQERQKNKALFSPYVTADKAILETFQALCPNVPITNPNELTPPYFEPVKLRPLKEEDSLSTNNSEPVSLVVGGAPAAMVAIQKSVDGKKVIYVNYRQKDKRPISIGAANHGEWDADTELPAYTAGRNPVGFFKNAVLELVNPTRFKDEHPDWLTLNYYEWFMNPGQWSEGVSVAWNNYWKANQYALEKSAGETPTVIKEMLERTQVCEKWLAQLDSYVGGIFLPGRGSMILAPRESDVAGLRALKKNLADEGRQLEDVNNEQALQKYGFVPRNSHLHVEKTHDRIFKPDFLDRIEEAVVANGGEVRNDWQLVEILVDVKKEGAGKAIFLDKQGNKQSIVFNDATLSLGITDIDPKPYVMSSVTGISINALLYGVALKGPIVCGGSNHVVPLGPPTKIIKTDPQTGKTKEEIVTPVRATAAASVGPRFRDDHSYDFPGIAAVELVRRINQTLPENVKVEVVSAFGCNRMFGPDGMSTWLSPSVEVDGKKVPVKSIRMQVGAGGGGLTQSAYEAARIAANPEKYFPDAMTQANRSRFK